MRLWVDAALGIVRRDAQLFVSYRMQVVSRILSAVFSLALFYYVSRLVGGSRLFPDPADYFTFVVVGLIIIQVLVTTLGTAPVTIRQELVSGTIERLLVSPFGVVGGILAMMAFPFLVALATAVLTVAVAAAFFGFEVASTAPLAVPVALLSAVAFLPFSLLLAAVVVLFKQAGNGVQFVMAGLSIAGGLYFPVSLLPSWIRWTSDVQPFTPAAQVLRHLLAGAPVEGSISGDLLKLAGFAVVLLPLSLVALRAAVRAGQRQGTIFEY